MAVKLECDGCEATIPTHQHDARHGDQCRGCRQGHDGHPQGVLDPVIYCDRCKAAWDQYEAAEQQARIRAVIEFEAWRRFHRRDLRQTVKRLPDDWDADDEADGTALPSSPELADLEGADDGRSES